MVKKVKADESESEQSNSKNFNTNVFSDNHKDDMKSISQYKDKTPKWISSRVESLKTLKDIKNRSPMIFRQIGKYYNSMVDYLSKPLDLIDLFEDIEGTDYDGTLIFTYYDLLSPFSFSEIVEKSSENKILNLMVNQKKPELYLQDNSVVRLDESYFNGTIKELCYIMSLGESVYVSSEFSGFLDENVVNHTITIDGDLIELPDYSVDESLFGNLDLEVSAENIKERNTLDDEISFKVVWLLKSGNLRFSYSRVFDFWSKNKKKLHFLLDAEGILFKDGDSMSVSKMKQFCLKAIQGQLSDGEFVYFCVTLILSYAGTMFLQQAVDSESEEELSYENMLEGYLDDLSKDFSGSIENTTGNIAKVFGWLLFRPIYCENEWKTPSDLLENYADVFDAMGINLKLRKRLQNLLIIPQKLLSSLSSKGKN